MIPILIGFIAGTVSGMGMGGGVILILCLSLFLSIDQKTAQATNLLFFIPTSIAAILMNSKKKIVNYPVAKTVIVTGMLGSILGALLAQKINVMLLKKLFGVFLAFVALHEIDVLKKEYKNRKRNYTIKKQ